MTAVLAFARRGPLFLALSLAALAVYAPRICRTVTVMGDSAELVAAAAQWGVPHPPGYPLYTFVAHLFADSPLFELPRSVHFTSALFHAVTVGVVGCLVDLLSGSLGAALIAAFALALSETFFSGSLYAEVFPLNDLLFACLLFLSCAIAHGSPSSRRWLAFGVVLGLALSHHHMIVLAFPALVVLLARPLAQRRREHPWGLAWPVVAAVAIPALFYPLIPLAAARNPLPSWGDVRDLDALLRVITRQDYGGPLHASRHVAAGQLLERLDAFAVSTARSFGAAGILLFGVGAWAGVRHHRTTGGALLLAFFAAGPLFAMLNTVDIHSDYRLAFFARFASMSHVPFAVSVGLGAAAIETLSRAYPRFESRGARAALTAIIGAITTAPLVLHLGTVDLRDDASGLAYAHDLVTSVPDDAVLLLKSDAASQAALYVCAVERACGGRIVLTPGQLWMPWKRRELERRYPTFALPPEGSTSVARWLVERNVSKRPVFLHPELVDEAVHGEIAVLPSLLLFRAYADETALRADRARFRAEIVGIVARARCEGCALAREGGRSPAAARLARLYDAAIAAHQLAAAALGLDDDAKALAPLRAPSRRGN